MFDDLEFECVIAPAQLAGALGDPALQIVHSLARLSVLDTTETAVFGSPSNVGWHAQFEIDSAYQGQEGVLLVKKALEEGRPYALAFVDVRMPPGWDGVETARKIWEIDPDIQIVHIQQMRRRACRQQG